MNTMTILNMLTRAAIGVTSTLVGVGIGKKVADSHNTSTAVAAASAATLLTYVSVCEIYEDFRLLIQQKPVEATFAEDEFDEVDATQEDYNDQINDDGNDFPSDEDEETSSGDQIEEDVDGNEFPSMLTLTFEDPDTSESSLYSGDNEPDDTAEEEDELKVEARDFLKMSGGDPTLARVINATLLKACLDSLLADPALYKIKVSEDDDRVYLSGTAVNLIEEIACVALINPGGECDYEAHSELKKLSSGKYFITPGETDSFGWLTGVINTPAGIIVYG